MQGKMRFPIISPTADRSKVLKRNQQGEMIWTPDNDLYKVQDPVQAICTET